MKTKKNLIVALMTLASFFFVINGAQAGPQIDFGEEGYLQLDLRLQGFIEHTPDFGSGKDGLDGRTDINLKRNRITMTGMINDTYGIKMTTDNFAGTTRNMFGGGYDLSPNYTSDSANSIKIIDAYGVAMFSNAFNLKVGLSKIPLTRANLDDCYTNLTDDRSPWVYSPFGSYRTNFSRNLGIVANGAFADEKFRYWAAIVEGREGRGKWTNPFNDTTFYTTNEPESNVGFVGRIHYAFLDAEGGGYQGSYLGKKKVFTIGAGLAYEGDAAWRNTEATINPTTKKPYSIGQTTSTNTFQVVGDETVDYFAYTFDVFFEYPFDFGTITATALYLNADMDDAYKTVGNAGDLSALVGGTHGQKDGYYVKLGYMLPMTFGSKGKLQPYFFHENWDLAYLLGVYDQNVQQYGFGINYYVLGDNRVRVSAQYYDTKFDKETKVGDYETFTKGETFDSYDSFRMMFQFVF